jgi:hypothetical protein
LVTNHPWDWYLTNAYETSVAMVKLAPGYAVFGQMEGDIFLQVLEDLRSEGWNAQADDLEEKMRVRANRGDTTAARGAIGILFLLASFASWNASCTTTVRA